MYVHLRFVPFVTNAVSIPVSLSGVYTEKRSIFYYLSATTLANYIYFYVYGFRVYM